MTTLPSFVDEAADEQQTRRTQLSRQASFTDDAAAGRRGSAGAAAETPPRRMPGPLGATRFSFDAMSQLITSSSNLALSPSASTPGLVRKRFDQLLGRFFFSATPDRASPERGRSHAAGPETAC